MHFYRFLFILGLWVVAAMPAIAAPGFISGPSVSKGVVAIESSSAYAFDYDSDEYEFEQELELEYGFTDRLLLKSEIEFKKETGEETKTDKVALGLRYALGEQGQYFVDTAIKAGYNYATDGGADKAELGLVMQKALPEYALHAEVTFSHELGDDSEDGYGLKTSLGAYKGFDGYDAGIEYYADMGNLDTQSGYSAQKHSIGPVIGKDFHLDNHTEVELRLGYFQGISQAADDGALKLKVELEF